MNHPRTQLWWQGTHQKTGNFLTGEQQAKEVTEISQDTAFTWPLHVPRQDYLTVTIPGRPQSEVSGPTASLAPINVSQPVLTEVWGLTNPKNLMLLKDIQDQNPFIVKEHWQEYSFTCP